MDANKFEFGNFCQVAARFMLEEDEEGMREELKEAFRSEFLPSQSAKFSAYPFCLNLSIYCLFFVPFVTCVWIILCTFCTSVKFKSLFDEKKGETKILAKNVNKPKIHEKTIAFQFLSYF